MMKEPIRETQLNIDSFPSHIAYCSFLGNGLKMVFQKSIIVLLVQASSKQIYFQATLRKLDHIDRSDQNCTHIHSHLLFCQFILAAVFLQVQPELGRLLGRLKWFELARAVFLLLIFPPNPDLVWLICPTHFFFFFLEGGCLLCVGTCACISGPVSRVRR